MKYKLTLSDLGPYELAAALGALKDADPGALDDDQPPLFKWWRVVVETNEDASVDAESTLAQTDAEILDQGRIAHTFESTPVPEYEGPSPGFSVKCTKNDTAAMEANVARQKALREERLLK